jgi:type IV pilus assembly protein PilM
MAKQKKILVLDLGMQAMRLAEFSSTSGGNLRLMRGARREFLLDPSLDTSRPEQIGVGVRQMLREWKLAGGEVTCILPAHSVFTRVVPLEVPGEDASRVAAVAAFEAQQNIPFPLDEVIWNHTVMGRTSGGALIVVFVAVKKDVLESVCQAVGSAGLTVATVTVAPIALYDTFRVTYPEEAATSTTLLLDIGSRTSNMIVAAPGSYFSRSIPSGGLAVTSAIAKDIHSELDEAEHLKTSRGSVGLGAGFEPPADPVASNLARISRQMLLKTQADISRSLSYYRTHLGGDDPERILLTGGMASMPYLAEFLSEKIQKPISFFDPLQGLGREDAVHSTAADFIESNPHNLGELIGGALTITSLPRTPINLLPEFLADKRDLLRRLPLLSVAAAVFLATIASWFVYAAQSAAIARRETAKISAQYDSKNLTAIAIKKANAHLAELQGTADELMSALQLRDFYPSLLAELNERIPARHLWITDLQTVGNPPKKGSPVQSSEQAVTAVAIKGLYLDNPRQAAVIDDFVTSLQSSKFLLVEEKEKSKIITQRGTPDGTYWAYPFSLRIPLKQALTPLP